MMSDDREFIVRALAAHVSLITSLDQERAHKFISDFANMAPAPKSPEPKLVRTADGREFLVRDRRVS